MIQIHKSYFELPLQGSPHLNVFYGTFSIQPLLNFIEGSFERKTFLDENRQHYGPPTTSLETEVYVN